VVSISVIIPTHNRPGLLRRAITSSINQSLLPKEVLVIDDLEDIATKRIVEEFHLDFVRYIANVNGNGPSSSRNLGISEASGDYVAFLDDDDEFRLDKLNIISKVIEDKPDIDVVYHRANIVLVNEGLSYSSGTSAFNKDENFLKKLLVSNVVGGTPLTIVKRETIINAGFFDEKMIALEDYELWLRLAQLGCSFYMIDCFLTNCYYYTAKISVSKGIKENKKSLAYIEKKYASDICMLSPLDLKNNRLWKGKMFVQKNLLNGNRWGAVREQVKVFLSVPSVKNIAIFILIFLGPKIVFKVRSKVG
jgi:glycosyltransferase involved in cell wall biosynthesis